MTVWLHFILFFIIFDSKLKKLILLNKIGFE